MVKAVPSPGSLVTLMCRLLFSAATFTMDKPMPLVALLCEAARGE